jgi:predicted DNA binding CopG/RHH family protein
MKKEYNLKKLKRRQGQIKVDENAAKVPISIRLDGSVLASLKSEAKRLGIPYQTLLGSILHRYAEGTLMDQKVIETAKKFKVS